MTPAAVAAAVSGETTAAADVSVAVSGVASPPLAADPAPLNTTTAPPNHWLPLSDVMCTTSGKLVDLADPDVRQMLTDLVTFEIDQAAEYRRQGQASDAIVQLAEAEKISSALGMHDSAAQIHAMMEQIRPLV